MAAVAFTLAVAAADQLVYSWTGDAAGTLTYATLVSNAVTGPLKTALQAITGECNTDAKATAALVTGASFTGTNGTARQTWIQASVLSVAAVGYGLAATEDPGVNDQPLLTLTPAASTGGFLYLTHIHSVVR